MSDVKPDRFLRLNDVLDRTGLSCSSLYRKIEAGSFPRQIHIAQRSVGWRESAIAGWMQNPMCWQGGDEV